MSVSVSMPQLGESVTEGTVTRWLKKEGERVEADEPLLEVSTDKVDTEIPSPVSGILRGITVAEDETVAVGAELAVIDESADGAGAAPTAEAAPAQAPPAEAPPAEAPPAEAPPAEAPAAQAPPAQAPPAQAPPAQAPPAEAPPAEAPPAEAPAAQAQPAEAAPEYPQAPAAQEYPQAPAAPEYAPGAEPGYEPADQPAAYAPPAEQAAPPAAPQAEQAAPPAPAAEQAPAAAPAAEQAPPAAPAAEQAPPAAPEADGSRPADVAPPAPAADATAPAAPAPPSAPPAAEPASAAPVLPSAGDGPYVTPLVRKLAAEHGVDLGAVPGTGVGGRIRKQDVLEAARAAREGAPAAAAAAPAATTPAATTPAATTPAATTAAPPAPPATTPAAAAPAAPATAPARDIVPSTLRGTTERMSRARQLIARRMVESLQTSAQLTTVAEADVTLIARLRDRAKADFEAREGVKLSFLPFFALATVEALKIHPKLNAVIDTEAGQVTYHDAEHLGIAVDTERGLMVPVIQNAGDLNIGGLARKIADLAARTRAGQVSPDDLSGGTFTLTNTGSRGALFDTPIINQPQVAILGTGSVVKRPVVVEDPQLGEVITVRSMVYLALTYDHRLVDGADAARFLATVKDRLEEGEFEAELGL
jgi:pyruvate dehydrogenase E2 component (dihydrolipoamide acetyltransferase)